MLADPQTFGQITSPKQPQAAGKRAWYGYYAGFQPSFVTDSLGAIGLKPGQTLLDPWLGSGTTAVVAHSLGVSSVGFDINPALILIAKARHLPVSVRSSLSPLCGELWATTLRIVDDADYLDPADPLVGWFRAPACRLLRAFHRAISLALVSADDTPEDGNVSTLAAFFYVAAFRVVRLLVADFRATNPNWIRQPLDHRRRRNPGPSAIERALQDAVEVLASRLEVDDIATTSPRSGLFTANSCQLPLQDDQIDAVLTSPPYCTRLDYAVGTAPELAFLGTSRLAQQRLRTQDFGSPLTTGRDQQELSHTYISSLLDTIRHHPSKSSATYYTNYYRQYFSGLALSLKELDRVTKSNSPICLVVQDSSYKDIHVDLQRATTELMEALGRHPCRQTHFKVPHNRSHHNPHHRLYTPTRRPSVESLLVYT